MSLDRGDDSDRMLELCRQAVDHDPEFTEAHREIIRLTEDKDQLRQEYEWRVQENPDSAVFHYLLGEVAEGDAKQAHYEKAIELDPGSPWGYLGLGELLEDRRSFDEALTNYQRVLALEPTSELGHRGLARTFGRMGRREDEIAAYRKMISELPDVARGYWGLMRAYEKAERDTDAASLLQQIYERFRSDPRNGGLALYEMAESLEDQDQKVRLWNRFIEDYPTGPNIVHVYDYLLKHYVETDPEKTEALARECLEKEEIPDDKRLKNYVYQALFDLYWKLERLGRKRNLCRNSWNRDIRIRWHIRKSQSTTRRRGRRSLPSGSLNEPSISRTRTVSTGPFSSPAVKAEPRAAGRSGGTRASRGFLRVGRAAQQESETPGGNRRASARGRRVGSSWGT